MKVVVALFFVVVAVVGACGPEPDRCVGFPCDKGRICIDIATGPTCVCSDGTETADDAGVCVDPAAVDAGP